MPVAGFPEKNVHRQGFVLPPNLQHSMRAGLLLLHRIDQIEWIRQRLTVEGKQQVSRLQPGPFGIGTGRHSLDH